MKDKINTCMQIGKNILSKIKYTKNHTIILCKTVDNIKKI